MTKYLKEEPHSLLGYLSGSLKEYEEEDNLITLVKSDKKE